MIDFIIYNKGKITSIIIDILLLIWWLHWHYYRFKYMMIHNYEPYLICDDIGCRIFFTIFVIIFIVSIGYLSDKIFNGEY